ncbi:hypothetical protein [Pelagerythrobacter marinus]|uniref:hypothetical protein n=1 Tax=Pelagerythrobacter marinus TaxID=538382 RepID=UPI002AC9D279|nr:hypothetical protein [Pelagerythrobacter marinus]WPZ05474.1 hypothetical protein T8T98_08515 [Pelagerythrobacter marinus]
MKALAAIAAGLSVASAAPVERPYFAGMPPERFQGEGVAIVMFADDVNDHCPLGVPAGYTLLGCAFQVEGTPVLVLPNPCPMGDVELFARIACHELGHRNGWSGGHEL